MELKEIKTYLSKGYIQCIVIFEVVGNPKEHVQKALENHLSKAQDDKRVKIISKAIEKPVKEGDMWTSFAEVEMLVKTLETLTWICLEFMPASVEIMAPGTSTFKAREITGWLNDLLSKSHNIGVLSQQLGQQNKLMLKNMNALLRNSILLCIDSNIKDSKAMAQKIGLDEKSLEPVFQAMVQENKIQETNNGYERK